MTVFLILLAIFIAWHFIPKPEPAGPQPKFRRDARIRADDPHWPQFVEKHCESPAEAMFLRAVIDAFELQPENGSLRGRGLQFDFQVEEGRYRADFLANGWLVVEIDGATYHSSPEARARDRVRDAYFEELGYSVLRIPAKTVFDQPEEAVTRLRSALSVGKRQVESPVPQNGFDRLRETAAAIGRGAAKLNEYVDRAHAKQEALSEAHTVAYQERQVIELAVEKAELTLRLEAEFRCNKEFEQLYKQELARLQSLLDDSRSSPTVIVVPEFPLLPTHDDALTAQSIEAEYNVIQEERKTLFEEARRKIREEPRLKPLVEKELTEIGCPEVFVHINVCEDSEPPPTSAADLIRSLTEEDWQRIRSSIASRESAGGGG